MLMLVFKLGADRRSSPVTTTRCHQTNVDQQRGTAAIGGYRRLPTRMLAEVKGIVKISCSYSANAQDDDISSMEDYYPET